jgi:hypothetical protein
MSGQQRPDKLCPATETREFPVETSYEEVILGIASTFVAFLLGLVWRRLSHWIVNFRSHRFWRPFMHGRVTFILGRFSDLPTFEPCGLVGAGDNLALTELTGYFQRIGFKGFTIVYADQIGWADRKPLEGNLILIGGPDTNTLAKEVLERLSLGVEFLEVTPQVLAQLRGAPVIPRSRKGGRGKPDYRVPVFRDRTDGTVHGPTRDGSTVLTDCGVVIRCPNPFDRRHSVLILSGSYGFGTWGTARFVQTREFLDAARGLRSMECILTVDIAREMPQRTKVEVLRPVEEAVPAALVRVTVPRIQER